jgi:hypothetical protein
MKPGSWVVITIIALAIVLGLVAVAIRPHIAPPSATQPAR